MMYSDKNFWTLQNSYQLGVTEIALYFYLVEVSNVCGWIGTFKRSNSKICADLSISFRTLQSARDRLKQIGILDFKTRNGDANVTYTFAKFAKVSAEVSAKVSAEVSAEIIKNKNKNKVKKDTTNVVSKKATKPLFSLDFISDENFKKLFEEWLDYKRRVKHNSYKDQKQIELAYRKMYELGGGDVETCRAIVEQSIANNWQGLFELKTQSFNNQKTTAKNEQNKQSGAALGRVATGAQHRAVTL